MDQLKNISSKIFPNPASDNIQITSNYQINKVNIYNTLGELLIAKTINKQECSMNISQLNNGIYLVELIDDNGNKSCKKILIN